MRWPTTRRSSVGDQPTGNLNSRTADRVFQLFADLVAQGKTFIMVTHDNELAARIPRVIQVQDGVLLEGQGAHLGELSHAQALHALNGHHAPDPHV